MSDNTAYRVWKTCNLCNKGYWAGEYHYCTSSPDEININPDLVDYLRRIAEALEKLSEIEYARLPEEERAALRRYWKVEP